MGYGSSSRMGYTEIKKKLRKSKKRALKGGFVRDGSVQQFKIGGSKRLKRNKRNKKKSKRMRGGGTLSGKHGKKPVPQMAEKKQK